MDDGCENPDDNISEWICSDRAKYILAKTCGSECPCHFKDHYTHLNLVRRDMSGFEWTTDDKYERLRSSPLIEGENPPAQLPERKWINIRGREEHEAILKDTAWCDELGLDQMYEIMVYLKRWGGWLGQD